LLEQENPYKQAKARPQHSGREMKMAAMSSEIDLRGMDSVEAICVLDRYLDEAMRSNLQTVRIIHGKGTGVLRDELQKLIRTMPGVASVRDEHIQFGGTGVTIVNFE
jgi:DNA mismatch repair protein MutS2